MHWDVALVEPRMIRRPRELSGIQCYASHHQLYGVYSMIHREMTLWEHGVTMQI